MHVPGTIECLKELLILMLLSGNWIENPAFEWNTRPWPLFYHYNYVMFHRSRVLTAETWLRSSSYVFSFFLNSLCSWMTYSWLPFLLEKWERLLCFPPPRLPAPEVQLKRDICTKRGTLKLLSALKRSCRSAADCAHSSLSTLVSSLDLLGAEMGSGVIPRIVGCLFFIQKTRAPLIKPRKATERTMIRWWAVKLQI